MVKKATKNRKVVNNKSVRANLKGDVKTELTDVEKFYIEQKCKEGVSLEDIKKQNMSPLAKVAQVYAETKSSISNENKMTAGKLMSVNEKYGSVVMTPSSSEFADSKRAKTSSKKNEKKESHIHKFRERKKAL
jgi:hypothetical protein